MAVEKLEIETFFGKCKCCLNYGYLRAMWDQHVVEEEMVSYGLMLKQCFSIGWTVIKTEKDDQICKECIWKLREAHAFKKQVLYCQKHLEQTEHTTIKPDPDNVSIVEEYLEQEMLEESENTSDDESHASSHKKREESIRRVNQVNEDQDLDEEKQNSPDTLSLQNKKLCDMVINNEYCRYLDHRFEEPPSEDTHKMRVLYYMKGEDTKSSELPASDTPASRKRRLAQQDDESSSGTDAPKPKWPRKLPLEQRWKTYKQYSEDALKEAFNAVIVKKMSHKQAAKKYKVPRQTLGAKVKAYTNDQEAFPNTKKRQFYSEVKSVLTYLNVTPFRSRANQLVCFYCVRVPSDTFSSPEELRQHTRQRHPDFCYDLQTAMRPASNNTVVKLDVTDLACTTCDIPLPDWTDALKHLKVHGVNIECENKLIPYTLDDKLCVLCREQFSPFMMLDAHMNTHYRNHVCKICDEAFLTSLRLKTHRKTHQKIKNPKKPKASATK